MSYKKTIQDTASLIELFESAMAIQNKGIGTVFFWLSGHTNSLKVDVHCPEWNKTDGAAYTFYIQVNDEESLKDNMIEIKELLENGDTRQEEREAKKKQERLKQFEALKQEFELTS